MSNQKLEALSRINAIESNWKTICNTGIQDRQSTEKQIDMQLLSLLPLLKNEDNEVRYYSAKCLRYYPYRTESWQQAIRELLTTDDLLVLQFFPSLSEDLRIVGSEDLKDHIVRGISRPEFVWSSIFQSIALSIGSSLRTSLAKQVDGFADLQEKPRLGVLRVIASIGLDHDDLKKLLTIYLRMNKDGMLSKYEAAFAFSAMCHHPPSAIIFLDQVEVDGEEFSRLVGFWKSLLIKNDREFFELKAKIAQLENLSPLALGVIGNVYAKSRLEEMLEKSGKDQLEILEALRACGSDISESRLAEALASQGGAGSGFRGLGRVNRLVTISLRNHDAGQNVVPLELTSRNGKLTRSVLPYRFESQSESLTFFVYFDVDTFASRSSDERGCLKEIVVEMGRVEKLKLIIGPYSNATSLTRFFPNPTP